MTNGTSFVLEHCAYHRRRCLPPWQSMDPLGRPRRTAQRAGNPFHARPKNQSHREGCPMTIYAKSRISNSKQIPEASAEEMVVPEASQKTNDLQSALERVDEIKTSTNDDTLASQNSRFQQIVVVATQNQDLNREIAAVAYDLAEISGGKVSFLSVVAPVNEAGLAATAVPMGSFVAPVAGDADQAIKDREALLAELKADCGTRIEADTEVAYGLIEEVIGAYANDHNADVIVVGSPNRSWLEALFNPSTARSVTKTASCPVLVVPELIV